MHIRAPRQTESLRGQEYHTIHRWRAGHCLRCQGSLVQKHGCLSSTPGGGRKTAIPCLCCCGVPQVVIALNQGDTRGWRRGLRYKGLFVVNGSMDVQYETAGQEPAARFGLDPAFPAFLARGCCCGRGYSVRQELGVGHLCGRKNVELRMPTGRQRSGGV